MTVAERLLVLYGSQTFTAQEIAERIWRKTKTLGFRGPVQAMDDYPITELIHEEFAIFVCSTTGQGEEPDNMKRFWKFLLRKNLPANSLVKLKYGVLGLGDSSYPKFNFASKKLHKRLIQLGATPLVDVGLCDYQHDLGHDAVVSPWIREYVNKLNNYFPKIETDVRTDFIPRWKVSLITTDTEEKKTTYGLNKDIYFSNVFTNDSEIEQFELFQNVRTTDVDHFQDVRLLTLKTVGDSLSYKPGDVFNIRPRNSREDISDLFDIFLTHGLDIKPHYKLVVEEYHDGPAKAAIIGGFSGGANTLNSQDDEYRYAGVEDPKIMITTSREPSARLKMFVKELRLIFPNSQRMNRGGYEMSQLIHACRANEVTDFMVVHEHRGVPDSLVICHLPHGPTVSFTLSGVVMRHDIPDIGPMSEQYPHLVFHNFKTDLGLRTMSVLKYLFPVPKPDSKRVISFANHDDYICFRQHTYKKVGKDMELTELGPRFQMKLYEIKLGTLEALDAADTEWALRPYMNTAAKRRFLSDDDGWTQDE